MMAELMLFEQEEVPPEPRITVRCSDDAEVDVPLQMINSSSKVDQMIAESRENVVLPVPSNIVLRVINFWERNNDPQLPYGEVMSFNGSFMTVDNPTLHKYMTAAEWFGMEKLLDMCCTQVAGMITGKSVQEIQRIYGIQDDFTEEERRDVYALNHWAFQD